MRVKLKDVCEKATSNLKQSDILSIGGTYPVYGASGYLGNIDSYHQDKPYIAIVKDGAGIGRTTILPPKSSVIGTMQYLIPKENVMPEYLYYVVKHMRLQKYYTGATIPHIYFKDYQNEEFNLADSIRQREIVKVLKNVEDTIRYQEIEINKFDELIKARFIEMFKSVNDKVTIGSLCDVTSGYSFKSKDINSSNGIKLLQIGNVFFDNVNWETLNYLPDGYNIKYSKFLLNEGDIVVALTRPIIQSLGNVKACVVRELDVPCLLNQRVGRITPKKNIDANLEFIYECLMMNDFTKYVESCCIGCSQPNISVHDIENYLVPNVSLKQQERFVLFKKQVDKSRFDIKKSIIELEREVVYD